jgi:hypothetical protein
MLWPKMLNLRNFRRSEVLEMLSKTQTLLMTDTRTWS